jgi:hypothetical protein
LQSDPVGQSAGPSTYSFVESKPMAQRDPLGLDPGQRFGSLQAAASDMLRFIIRNSNEGRFDPTQEVGNWIIKDGKCYYYRDDLFAQNGHDHTPMKPRPKNAEGSLHTHRLFPQSKRNRVDLSDGDRSAENRTMYGPVQFTGGNVYNDPNGTSRTRPFHPVLYMNDGTSTTSNEVEVISSKPLSPSQCECTK